MATIAIGDVHGNIAALAHLLLRIGTEVGKGDSIVFLGDYIDRGPDAPACIDAILALREESPADIVCLKGNHEDWLLRTRDDYFRHSWLLGMDGLDTVRSYSPEVAETIRSAMVEAGGELYSGRRELPYGLLFDAMPASHLRFFDELALYYESAECLCSHAGVDPNVLGPSTQSPKALLWGHPAFPEKYSGAEPVVYGHWDNAVPSPDGWPAPAVVGNTIGVDTISHGVLSAVRMPDRMLFQSNGEHARRLRV